MRTSKAIALVLVFVPSLVFAQKKAKKQALPAVFDQARYVYVQAVAGDEFKRDLPTEDRLAIADVRDALHAWGRYTYTSEREKADLVFVVRKGRLESARAGVGIGSDPDEIGVGRGPGTGRRTQGQGPPGVVTEVGTEAGSEDDMLEVCQVNANGKLTNPLWIHSMPNGLSAPRLMLFVQLKQEVDRTYPKAPDTQTPKP